MTRTITIHGQEHATAHDALVELNFSGDHAIALAGRYFTITHAEMEWLLALGIQPTSFHHHAPTGRILSVPGKHGGEPKPAKAGRGGWFPPPEDGSQLPPTRRTIMTATKKKTAKSAPTKKNASAKKPKPSAPQVEDRPDVPVTTPVLAEPTTTPAPQKKGKKKAEAKPKKLSALDAAAKVLAESGQAMTCQEMIDSMAAKGYWTSPGGKTPAATLYSAILREVANKGDQARFTKTERGKFASAGAG